MHGPRPDPRWSWNRSFEKPTFTSTVLVRYSWPGGDGVCHYFVADGHVQFLGDCTHAVGEQAVDLPPWEHERWRPRHKATTGRRACSVDSRRRWRVERAGLPLRQTVPCAGSACASMVSAQSVWRRQTLTLGPKLIT